LLLHIIKLPLLLLQDNLSFFKWLKTIAKVFQRQVSHFALFAISNFSLGLLFAGSDFITFYLLFTPANIQCSRHPPSMIFVVSASSNKRNSIAVNRISPE